MLITDAEYQATRQWCREFVINNCLERRSKKNPLPGKASGSRYTWMFYLRRGLYNSEFGVSIAKMFLFRMFNEQGKAPFQLAGLESGAVPLLTGISQTARLLYGLDINVFSIRKEQKTYGLKNWIEGTPLADVPVVIVDDICNSSWSMKQCYDRCIAEGLFVSKQAFSIVNKVNKEIHEPGRIVTDMYLPKHIQITYLYDLDDFGLTNPSH